MIVLAKEGISFHPAVQQLWFLPAIAALVIPIGLGFALGWLRRIDRSAFVGASSAIITIGLIPVGASVLDISRFFDDPIIYLAGLPALVALLFAFVAWAVSSAVDRFAPTTAGPRLELRGASESPGWE